MAECHCQHVDALMEKETVRSALLELVKWLVPTTIAIAAVFISKCG